MANMKPAVIGVLIVIGIGVGFGGGYFFRNQQLSKMRGNFPVGGANTTQRFNGATRGIGQVNGQNGMMRGGATQGTILSMDDKSITVKMVDGSSKIVLLSDSTTYSNTVKSTQADVKAGTEVSVFGTPNSDGSVTAISVQLNPMSFRPQGSAVPLAK
jgi:hypothetical protein